MEHPGNRPRTFLKSEVWTYLFTVISGKYVTKSAPRSLILDEYRGGLNQGNVYLMLISQVVPRDVGW